MGGSLSIFRSVLSYFFILVGVIYDRAHHRDIEGFGGLASQMPIYTAFVAVAFFAGLGLPGFSGFVSEAMIFIGAFPVFKTVVIISTLGILLNAAYFLWAFQRMFFGPANEKYNDLPEINTREFLTLVPLAVITLILGVYPRPFLDLVASTLNVLIDSVVSFGGLAVGM